MTMTMQVRSRMRGLVAFALIATMVSCFPARTRRSDAPASALMGTFIDDYNAQHIITATEWRHGSRARYHIVKWNASRQFLIARNDSANPADGGLWTRIDWLPLAGMAPWTWGFCMSAYNAPTADSAEATRIVNRATPRTGCNGFPFTRMKDRGVGPGA